MARKLASIQTILKLEHIENADAIERATVLGWHCVVKKGDFVEGDPIVFFEVDSFLPVRGEFEFLRKSCYRKYPDGKEGFRLRTIRLRGQISQGLVMPLSILPDDFIINENYEGTDVTEVLNVELWQPPIPACLSGKVKGNFPSFMPKTDETRVQVLQDVLTRHKDTKCYITEKVDGSSGTFYIKDGLFGVCSRNLELLEDEHNAFWIVARELDLENKLRNLIKNIMLQGELCGPGIQENPLKLEKKQIFFFNVFDIDSYKYYDYNDMCSLLADLNLPMVPVLVYNFPLVDNIDELVEISKGKSSVNMKVQREGIVIRPLQEIIDLQMSKGLGSARVSFKAINPEYSLAEI